MKLSDCQIAVVIILVFIAGWLLLKVFVAKDSKNTRGFDAMTIKDAYFGPVNTSHQTGFDVLGNPFINPAPLYQNETQALNSQIPPFNVIASGDGF